MRRVQYSLVAIVALLVTSWAYQPVWQAQFVYEDRATLTTATTTGGWPRAVTHATWRWASTPVRAHALNLTLHLSLGSLLGVLAWRLGLTPFGAWIVALIWLLHPMATETVAYAKARSEQIVMLGTLVSMISASGRWWRPWSLVGIMTGGLLALGGEPSGVVVFLVVPLMIWHRRIHDQGPRWAPWWLPLLVAAGLIGAGVWWYGGLRAVVNGDTEAGIVDMYALTWDDWLWAQAGAVAYWLMAIVWPAWLTPDADVDRLSTLVRVLGLGSLGAGLVVAWQCCRRRPLVTLGLMWALLAVLPRLLVQTPRSYLNAEQFALSFMGLALVAGDGVERWRARWIS